MNSLDMDISSFSAEVRSVYFYLSCFWLTV
uniref:Uncharacterized protein n=1 Tax=Arundo donax TaxID=35708 RepID=A0A0A9FNX3_ARUDO